MNKNYKGVNFDVYNFTNIKISIINFDILNQSVFKLLLMTYISIKIINKNYK